MLSLCQYHEKLDFKKHGILCQMEEGVPAKEDEVSEHFRVLHNKELTNVCRSRRWAGHIAMVWDTLEYIQTFLVAPEHFEKL
jgi:hypothetical protein